MNDFNYAILDDDGLIIRKFRWSRDQYKWYTINNPNSQVIKLQSTTNKSTFQELLDKYGEALL